MLVACGDIITPPPARPPTPTALVFTPLNQLLRRSQPSSGVSVSTVGYVIVNDSGALLLDGLSFSAGATPQPLSGSAGQIWLGPEIVRSLGGLLHRAGGLRYAIVLARGRLEGPGVYGPDGSYRYRLNDARLQTLAPEETSIPRLLDNPSAYEGRIVRVAGSLLARRDSAMLVESIGPGGLPNPDVRQLKLASLLRDQALFERLKHNDTNTVAFGQVLVEGFWRDGQLSPLSFQPIDTATNSAAPTP